VEQSSVQVESLSTGGRARCLTRSGALRFPLVWPVYFWISNGGAPLIGKTLNISADSFYCIVPQQIQQGSRLACHVVVPSWQNSIALQCDIFVSDLEQSSNTTKFGIECTIERYSIVRWKGLREAPQ
jgi:hypothetical protein